MKKTVRIFVSILFGLTILFSCSENATSSEKDEKGDNDIANIEKVKEEQALAEKKKRDSTNLLLNGISVGFFEHTGGTYDSDGFFVDGGLVKQLKNFDNSKIHRCSKGAYIQKVSILGNCGNLNLQFFNKKGDIIEDLKNCALENKVEFETEIVYNPEDGSCGEKKGPNHKDWFRNVSKMTISYEDSVFYSASWKSSSQRWSQAGGGEF
jgi:hypothetical protein